MAFYSSGKNLEWREVETGQLPSKRGYLRATVVGNILFVTGGRRSGCYDDDLDCYPSVLSWDPVAETWHYVGELSVQRYNHAAIAVPKSVVECGFWIDFLTN